MTKLLAVYGTLKRGYGNHEYITSENLPLFSEAITKDAAFFMHGGGYPIVTTGPEQHRIAVELYEYETEDQLYYIDLLEGHPAWYRRKEYTFILPNGDEVLAQMYVQPPNQEASEHRTVTVENNIATWGYQ